MSPHVYRCRACGIATDPASTREDAERLRAMHRAAFHGETPDGIEETPEPETGGSWVTGGLLGLMAIGAVSLAARWLRRHT